MKRYLGYVVLGIAAVLGILLAVIALQPSEFMVERSTTIAAPASAIQPHIASLRAMSEWSPWTKMDSQMKLEYSGPEAGVGATQSWEGPQMGKGRLSVTAVKPDQEVEMKLEMLEPMAATNRIRFILEPAGAETRVRWRMDGTSGFLGKAMSLAIGLDEMIGEPFEQGLAALEAVVETEAEKLAAVR